MIAAAAATGPHVDSRLLVRLAGAVRNSRDVIEAACLRAERAGVLARLGQGEIAKTELDALREQFKTRPNVAVTTWISIVEGWLAHYGGDGGLAIDKLRRALALSTAFDLQRLQGLSAAWLGHFYYLRDDAIDAIGAHLRIALNVAKFEHHDVLGRACATAGTALHFCERMDLASGWYAQARQHARQVDDDSLVSAITYNMAANCSIQAFRLSVLGHSAQVLARRAMEIAASVDGFDCAFGTRVCPSFAPMMRAQSASILGDHAGALELYAAHFDAAMTQGMRHMKAVFWADIGWCRLHLGHHEAAKDAMAQALVCLDEGAALEERLAAHGRLAQACDKLELSVQAAVHRRRMLEDAEGLKAMQSAVLASLRRFDIPEKAPASAAA